MNSQKIISSLTLVAKIFFVWLLLQFFLQTFVTFRLWLDGTFWKIVWMRKEIIILLLCGFLGRYFWKQKNIQTFFAHFPLKNFVRVFLGTIAVTFLVSVGINHTGIWTRILSVRYSMIWFFIFLVFFTISMVFFGTKEINIVKRYSKIIKTLLVASLCRWGIIRLMPNLLKFAGYNQFNYEWDVGIAPPAAYYTQYDSGYVRNQFLFERPISRGFFLIAFWPLFFVLCFKHKPLQDKILRGWLYGLAVLSTFSRAAWWVRIIQTLLLIFMQFPKKYWKKALWWFVPLLLLFGVVTLIGQKQIISREFSNTWHLKHVVEALHKIAEKPLRWQGAGSAGPASHQIDGIKEYNPENQYLQIWLEYGLLWFIGWLYLYGYLHYIAYKSYEEEQQTDDKLTKKRKLYGMIVFAFGLGILWLSIEGVVLHSFVDRMIVYPFVALFAIAYGLYIKEQHQHSKI